MSKLFNDTKSKFILDKMKEGKTKEQARALFNKSTEKAKLDSSYYNEKPFFASNKPEFAYYAWTADDF